MVGSQKNIAGDRYAELFEAAMKHELCTKIMNHFVKLEICANSVTSALAAQAGGAVRIELCTNLSEGGTTPSHGDILMARKLLHIKLYALVRPRPGDFLYSAIEYDTLAADVNYCIEAGCDGIVIGLLNPDGTIDKQRCRKLAQMATNNGLGVTFHRAFDVCADRYQALEDIIEIGCERILTSGGKNTAIEGADEIAALVKKSGGRITIMPGSGINESNVAGLIKLTGATEVHSSARARLQSKMIYKNNGIFMGGDGESYSYAQTNPSLVRNILEMANR